jgi:type I restriction enzyme S subunit
MLRNAEGREHARLSDFCSKAGEGVSQAKLESEAAYVGLENMPRGSLWLHTVGTTLGLGSNKSRFHCGDVLFGKLRPYFRKVAIAPVNGVCSTDILVLRPHEPQDLALVSVVASSDDLIESVTSSATGTRMPRTSWSDLASWPLPTFNRRDREQLGAVTAPVIKGMLNLTRESHALAAIRDCLLPELIAGRIPMISSESSVRASDRL